MNQSSLDKFFGRIAAGCESLLAGASPPVPPAHWIVVARGEGLEVSPAPDNDGHHSQLVESLVASGADAAAHVAYLRNGEERLLTYAVVAHPLDSDVRSARIARPGATVSKWEAAL